MFGRVPGCCWLADGGHSTDEGPHHWTAASSFVQISPWCSILRHGQWSKVRDGFGTVRTSELAYQLWSEFVFGATPESGKAKLCVGV